MRIPAETLVLDVQPVGTGFRVRCPCCGAEGTLVGATPVQPRRRDVNDHPLDRFELAVDIVVDLPKARHSMRGSGLGSVTLRLVDSLPPARAPLPKGWETCDRCFQPYDPHSCGGDHAACRPAAPAPTEEAPR